MNDFMDLVVKEVIFIALLLAFFCGFNKVHDMKNNAYFEKADTHEELVKMHGVYEDNGLILTDDGHEWIYMLEEPLPAGSEVEIVFDTTDKPDETKWDLKAIRSLE